MTDKLKNCPFCGGEAKVYDYEAEYDRYDPDTLGFLDTQYRTVYGVCCLTCYAMMAEFNCEEAAIVSWNNRSPMDRVVAELEEERNKGFFDNEYGIYRCSIDLVKAIAIVKGVQNE